MTKVPTFFGTHISERSKVLAFVVRCLAFVIAYGITNAILWLAAINEMLWTNWRVYKPLAGAVGLAVGWVASDFVYRRYFMRNVKYPWGASKAAWIGSISVLVPCAVVLPAYMEMQIRSNVVEILLSAIPVRDEITSRIKKAPGLATAGVGIRAPTHPFITESTISPDGTIYLRGDKRGIGADVSIRMTPEYDRTEGAVKWKCLGEPGKYFVATCR